MDTLDPYALDQSMTAHLASKGVGFPELDGRDFRAFHNGLRILMNMDIVEMGEAGVLLSQRDTDRFVKDPIRFFVVASDERKAAIWAALQARQPADLKTPEDTEARRMRALASGMPQAGDVVREREDARALS